MSAPNENKPGYKETKVGWIPEEWSVLQLRDLGRITSGNTPSRNNSEYFNDGTFPWVKTTDLNNGIISSTEEFITHHAIKKGGAKLKPTGSVLVAMYGGYKQIGRTGVLAYEAAVNQAISVLTPSKKFSSLFVQCSLNVNVGMWRRFAGSSRKDPNITREDVSSFWIPFPPLSEQLKIAEIILTCDNAIEGAGNLLKAKQRQKKALMQQLLTGKKRLQGFEREWKDLKMVDLFRAISRPVKWDEEEYYNLISVRRRSGGLFFREALQGKDILTKVMNTTHTGDFLISKMQVVHGAMAMTPPDFDGGHVSGSYITLIAKSGAPIHMPFFDYLSRTKWLYYLTFISSYGVVIEKMTFNLQDFLKKTITIPPTIEEQERISDVLKVCEDQEAALRRKLAALKQQKKSLMQKLLTGQVRVKV